VSVTDVNEFRADENLAEMPVQRENEGNTCGHFGSLLKGNPSAGSTVSHSKGLGGTRLVVNFTVFVIDDFVADFMVVKIIAKSCNRLSMRGGNME
jgi:hypothetical protein